MYAIIQTGGKQYQVAPGDVIRIETLEGEKGDNGIHTQGPVCRPGPGNYGR